MTTPASPDRPASDAEADSLPLPALLRMAGVVAFAPFLSQVDTTIVNIALPTLTSEFQAPLSTVQWVASAYLLATALMIPLCGWLVDNIGAKRVYIGGFVFFSIASTCCAFAASIEQLIIFRAVQGMAGGLLAPMAQMMLARHAGPQMTRMMALISVPVMVAPILGPSIAGAILYVGSWHWLFLVNLPFGVLGITSAFFMLPPDGQRKPRRLDWLGFLLISPGLVFLLDGMHRLATAADGMRVGGGELILAISLLVVFVLRGWRLPGGGLFDLKIFARQNFRASTLTQFLSMANSIGGMMIMPLYLLMALNLPPSTVGLIIAPMGIGVLLTRQLTDRLIKRYGPRRVSVVGGLISLAATLPFAWPGLTMPLTMIAAILLVRGFGVGMINLPSIITAYAGLPREAVSHAATALNIVQRLGGPMATMTLALVISAQSEPISGAGSAASAIGTVGPEAFTVAFAVACLINIFCVLSSATITKRL